MIDALFLLIVLISILVLIVGIRNPQRVWAESTRSDGKPVKR